jgi:hypothetical protein
VRPIGAAEVGLFAALVGAWGAISVFVGPTFGYQPTSASFWDWTTQNWLLHLVPGAVAVFAGLMILAASPTRREVGRGPLGLAALLIIAAGSWFVLGPAAWPIFESGSAFATGTNATTNFINQLGSSLGPGLLLAILGGMAMKAGIARPAVALGEAGPTEVARTEEATRTEAPLTDAPRTDAPRSEDATRTPHTDAGPTDSARTETPPADAARTEAPPTSGERPLDEPQR